MYTNTHKQKALELRRQGYSYSYILKKVPVAKSTLSLWLKNIKFNPNSYTQNLITNARISSGVYKTKTKQESINKANLEAKESVGVLSNRDIAMLGLGIYIGEGGKTAGTTKITNSDPKIIRFAIRWFMETFNIKKEQFFIRLHLYPDNDEKSSINFWSRYTNIPESQFLLSIVDNRTDKKSKKLGKLQFGTATLSIKSLGNKRFGVYLHRLILAWINQVL